MKKTDANHLLASLIDASPRTCEQWRFRANLGHGGIARLGTAILNALETGQPIELGSIEIRVRPARQPDAEC